MLSSLKSKVEFKGQSMRFLTVITMYNEDFDEIEFSMSGLLQNCVELAQDKRIEMEDDEMTVVIVCDGHDKIPD